MQTFIFNLKGLIYQLFRSWMGDPKQTSRRLVRPVKPLSNQQVEEHLRGLRGKH